MKKSQSSKETSAGQAPAKKSQTLNIIQSIKESESKLYLAITGGGTEAISNILKGGGASKVFVGAVVPYNEDMLRNLIGSFDKSVSVRAAQRLAISFPEIELEDNQHMISIGCTCSLVKAEQEREGRVHHICLSVRTSKKGKDRFLSTKPIESMTVQLKGSRTREEEEQIVTRLIEAYAACYMNLTKWHPITYKPVFSWIGLTQDDVILTYNEWDKNALQDVGD